MSRLFENPRIGANLRAIAGVFCLFVVFVVYQNEGENDRWKLPQAVWHVICLLAAVGLFSSAIRLWVEREMAKRRRSDGLCPCCGYDVRASPGGCPECGETLIRPGASDQA